MQSQTVPLQSDSSPVRIVIAAVQSAFRALLRGQLESETHFHVVGAASDTRAALALTRRLKPHILVIECALNRELSIHRSSESCRETTPPAFGIVVIVETPRIEDIVEALELGARGIVLRASLPIAWKTGLSSILAGQYWVED